MQRSFAFSRITALMAAVGGLMGGNYAGMPGIKAANTAEALGMLGGYQSRGKRKTKTHDYGGVRMAQRRAEKRRNQVRNRKAHRRAQGKGA